MLKKLVILTSITALSLTPIKSVAIESISFDKMSHWHNESVFLTKSNLIQHLAIEYESSVFENPSHKIYGIAKTLWKKLGLDTEIDDIDDKEEYFFRDYAIFFVIFGLIFVWVAYQSLTSMNPKDNRPIKKAKRKK